MNDASWWLHQNLKTVASLWSASNGLQPWWIFVWSIAQHVVLMEVYLLKIAGKPPLQFGISKMHFSCPILALVDVAKADRCIMLATLSVIAFIKLSSSQTSWKKLNFLYFFRKSKMVLDVAKCGCWRSSTFWYLHAQQALGHNADLLKFPNNPPRVINSVTIGASLKKMT